jgi:hypothetical protein
MRSWMAYDRAESACVNGWGVPPSARGSDLDARQAPVDRRETGLRAIVDA